MAISQFLNCDHPPAALRLKVSGVTQRLFASASPWRGPSPRAVIDRRILLASYVCSRTRVATPAFHRGHIREICPFIERHISRPEENKTAGIAMDECPRKVLIKIFLNGISFPAG